MISQITTGIRLAAITACFACHSLAFLAVAPAASAQDGAWKVGPSYVIRFQHLDLDQPSDRRALLKQVERSASKLCEGEKTKARRKDCAETAVAASLRPVPGHVRRAVEIARLERDGEQQAQR